MQRHVNYNNSHDQVIKLLKKYSRKGITMLDYLTYCGKTRLTNRISELKALGYNIESKREDGNYSRYWIR
jgi:biotin operon repressor